MLHLINGYLPWEDAYNLLHPHDEDALQTNSYLHGEDAYNFLLNTRSSLTGVTFEKWVSSRGGCLQSPSSSW